MPLFPWGFRLAGRSQPRLLGFMHGWTVQSVLGESFNELVRTRGQTPIAREEAAVRRTADRGSGSSRSLVPPRNQEVARLPSGQQAMEMGLTSRDSGLRIVTGLIGLPLIPRSPLSIGVLDLSTSGKSDCTLDR